MVKITFPLSLLALHAGQARGDDPCGQGSSECDDAPGVFGECCIDQSTYCVAPRGSFSTSTCCPRWTVGCTVGSVGCCDPARPWQLLGAASGNGTRTPLRRKALEQPSLRFQNVAAEAAAPWLAFGIFTEALSVSGGLSAVTIDATSGALLSRRDVSGPVADWYASYFGEATRVLPWDAAGARFVFADAELSSGQMTVYTIDPASGQSTGQVVSGCTGNPVGLAWDADLGTLVVSTQSESEVSFFAVNPDSGSARALGKLQRGADEQSESFYAAYVSHAHGGVAFRSGHQQVTMGQGEGLGVTKLPGSSDVAFSSWGSAAKADSHGLPVSMQRHPVGGFVSLAPRSAGLSLDVVSWAANGSAQVLAELGSAGLPSSLGMTLGYVADAPVVGDTYAAMTVKRAGAMGVGDKWMLSTVSLSSGAVSEFALSPQPCVLGAESISLTGFGLPQSQPPAPPAPPTPVPSPAPEPTPAPTPSDCPGGSLEACLHLCPADPQEAYVRCVQDCGERCPSAAVSV